MHALLLALLQTTTDLTERFEAPKGARVTLWAQSPRLYNPTAIDVDARGRVWVAEAVNYRKWGGRNPGLAFEKGDRIVILEDTDGDALCDKTTVFAQDPELVAPLGIAVFDSRVLVSCSPTAWIYTDEDGDDVADRKEKLLSGFGGFDHDHGLHSFVAGPEGRLWFSVGNAGPHLVTDALGWTLRSGSIYCDGGAELADNKPGLVSDDRHVWTGGLVLGVDPSGARLRVAAHNFRNNYEVALDAFGNLFQTDNDDGPPVSRTLWCMEGGNHGFFSEDGSRMWSADRRPGQGDAAAHWHVDDPGVVPPGCVHGSGGPTGLCVYEGQLFRGFEGFVLDADAGRNVVYAHQPTPAGAGITLKHGEFLKAKFGAGFDDESHRFRPSDVAVALDGAVFVADWYDAGVGGHAMADEKGHGRILRIAPESQRFANPKLSLQSNESALSALLSPAVNARLAAFEMLAAQREKVAARVKLVLLAPNPRHAARGMWLLAQLGEEGRAAVREKLNDPLPDLRITALRALRAAGVDPMELAKFVQDDPDPRVAAELAIALRDVEWERAGPVLTKLASRAGVETDPYYLEALGIGAQGKERELWDAVGPKLENGASVTNHDFWLAWRLRVDAALPLLRRVAEGEPYTPALDAIGFLGSREAAETMLTLALSGPKETREYAAWWVRFRDGNTWRSYGLARQLGEFERERSRKAWSSGPMTKSEMRTAEVELGGAAFVMLAVSPCDNGIGYDWADWIEPRFEGPNGATRIAQLPWIRATSGYGSTLAGKSCEGGALVVDGTTYADGIGTHAASEIVVKVPAGATKLVTRCSPDDYGSDRAGSQTKIEFEIWLDVPPDRTAFETARRTLGDAAASAEARERAARELARDRDGALALVHFAEQGKLQPELRAKLAPELLRHADPAVRALAAAQFRPESGAGVSAADVLALTGDRKRGRDVYFGSASTCSQCHAVRGRGGDVGPDLSDVRAKYARGELLEQILAPSKSILFGYETWTVETEDGRIHSGFLQAGRLAEPGDGVVVLKGTDGKRDVFEEREIESARRSKVSVMPDNVAVGLSAQELADVLAFLQHDAATPPKLGEPIALFDGQSLEGWTCFLDDPALELGDVWSVRDGAIHGAGRPAGYLATKREFTSFVLELDWRWDPSEVPSNSGVLLRKHGPDQIWPRAIEAQLMHQNAGDIWNIGEFPMRVDPARTDGRHTSKLAPSNERPIGEWNHYRITLNEGELALEVNGVLQNTATWCEERAGAICLQSEGSAIEFRNVVLTPIE